MSDTLTITPLSEYRGDWTGFLAACSYAGDDGWASDRNQIAYVGDRALLLQLLPDEGCSVAGVSEDRLRDVVEEVEFDLGGRWRLAGDETQPLRERLDRHFQRRQEARHEQRRERDETLARQAREREEQRVIALRIDITAMRETVTTLQARIDEAENQLKVEATRLGLEPWPAA